MKKKFLGKLVALTLVAAMAFTGCGKQPEEAKTDDGAATETTETTERSRKSPQLRRQHQTAAQSLSGT